MNKEQTDGAVALSKALLEIQKKLQAVTKDKKNPFFKSNYADLNAHLDVIKPLLNEHGLVLEQSCTMINTQTGPVNAVMSRVTHVDSATNKESIMQIPDCGGDMQKIGGAITYARRYTLSALFSMQAEDDDGNTAVGKTKKPGARSELF